MPGGKNGTILKKFGSKENAALQSLMEDSLRSFVPEFKQVVEMNGEGNICYTMSNDDVNMF